MQYVRCESCGAKAILAASRCPKCTHPLELRDHHGEMYPLAHCRKCDTWYPRSRGGCKWCGTKPSNDRALPIAAGVGVVLLVAAAGWWFTRSAPAEPLAADAPAVAQAPSVDSVVVEPAALPAADTAGAPIDTSATIADSASMRAGSAPAPPLPAAPVLLRQDTVTFRKFARGRVVQFVNVRVAPNGDAAVMAVLAPGVRLDIGGRQRGWRLVRAEGVTGWADPRNFRVDSGPPR